MSLPMFFWGAVLYRLILGVWGATYVKFGEEIGQSFSLYLCIYLFILFYLSIHSSISTK